MVEADKCGFELLPNKNISNGLITFEQSVVKSLLGGRFVGGIPKGVLPEVTAHIVLTVLQNHLPGMRFRRINVKNASVEERKLDVDWFAELASPGLGLQVAYVLEDCEKGLQVTANTLKIEVDSGRLNTLERMVIPKLVPRIIRKEMEDPAKIIQATLCRRLKDAYGFTQMPHHVGVAIADGSVQLII